MRKLLTILALVFLPQIILAQGKFSGFKGHSIFKIVSADSAETVYGILFRDDVQFLANFIANLSSGEVTRFIAPGGDTLTIGPAGFSATNSYAAGTIAFQYKDGTTVLVSADTTGDFAINGGDLTTTATTFNLLNATATTINMGGAATQFTLTTTGAGFGTTAPRAQYSQEGSTPQAYWTDTDVNTTRANFAGATDSAAIAFDASVATPTITIKNSTGGTALLLNGDVNYIAGATRITGNVAMLSAVAIGANNLSPVATLVVENATPTFAIYASDIEKTHATFATIDSSATTIDGNGWQVYDEAGRKSALQHDGTDAEVHYLRMINTDGEICYVYPNATQDGIVVSATKP